MSCKVKILQIQSFSPVFKNLEEKLVRLYVVSAWKVRSAASTHSYYVEHDQSKVLGNTFDRFVEK